jgi:CDGSH-type Zn-finger protein
MTSDTSNMMRGDTSVTQRPKKDKQVDTETRTQEKSQEQTQAKQQMTVAVTANGPYVVKGNIPLARQVIEPNDLEESWSWSEDEQFKQQETYHLCHCGGSGHKPFCDGSHMKNGFDGTETAGKVTYGEQAESIDGPELTLTDALPLCAFARFCDAQGQIWNLVEQEGDVARSLTMHEAGHCPSGRLMTWREREDGKMELAGEPTFEPSIGRWNSV